MPITSDVLRRYKQGNLFVETGCYLGEGIQAALDAGFTEIISLELDRGSVNRARRLYRSKPVTLIQGDTVVMLPRLLETIDEPCTFWLDAHPPYSSPIIEELKAFESHPTKTHTILVDDRRLMMAPGREGNLDMWDNVTEEAVVAALKRINPAYEIIYADGYVADDIIVAVASR